MCSHCNKDSWSLVLVSPPLEQGPKLFFVTSNDTIRKPRLRQRLASLNLYSFSS